MSRAVKIRTLPAPSIGSGAFDPGRYLSLLDFYETDEPITEADRDGLAQIVHYLAYLTLESRSPAWDRSFVARESLAHRALDSHFGSIPGWSELPRDERGLQYHGLTAFLMGCYPPRGPRRNWRHTAIVLALVAALAAFILIMVAKHS